MQTLFQAKEQLISDTPLLLFDCVYTNGSAESWSTHAATVNGNAYMARVLKQNVFEMQLASDLGVDAIPRITVELANADSHFSEIERSIGVKGSQLTVSIVFYNLPSQSPSSTSQVLFKGVLNAPELITEETFRVSASNRLSLQRVLLPDTRIQKRCPWDFPATAEQRQEAVLGGSTGAYSRFYRCGYSPDITGGVGNVDPTGLPYTSCAYTRSDCTDRGMFNLDSSSRTTARFGGIEFVPSTITVRSAGEKGNHLSPVSDNEARYNDMVPLIYGTAWHSPSVVFARNDGNLTHFEVLLGMGQIQDIQKVLVNQIEIPIGQAGLNMTGTGWYSLVGVGQRSGVFNPDFTDANHTPLGDPYGSMAYLSIVTPNRINDGTSLPSIKILIDGLLLNQYAGDGTSQGQSFSNNPSWIVLDLLSRIGWSLSEFDLPSFAATAAYCAESIQTTDLFGNPIMTPRFQCNLVLKSRRAASDVIRGVRNAARLFLRYGPNGLLQLIVENSIALQQPSPIPSSNAENTLNGGWPAYEFGDGTSFTTGIARTANRASSVRLSSKANSDSPNRFVAEFQDAFNEYQQDSVSVVDPDDVAKTGQEITSNVPVLGLPHYDQAGRILQFFLDKSVHGNTVIEFQTSVKALGLTPGDIIAVTYLKEGFERQPFRVIKIQPGVNFRTAVITGQIHDDSWYYDTNGQTPADASRRQGAYGIGLPRPLGGTTPDGNGDLQFGVVESVSQSPDGTTAVTATVSFAAPAAIQLGGPDIPLVSLASTVSTTAGTLGGGQDLYYAITSVSSDGSESALSFIVHASIPVASETNSVTLTGLSFPKAATAFQVYRGFNPAALQQVASMLPIASTFTDAGLPNLQVLPPDPNYDHADFYWRLELQPPVPANEFTAATIGSAALEMIPGSYVGMTTRIITGTGMGQERTIASNTSNTINLTSDWILTPDATSTFVVAAGAFQFGATTRASPVQFTIPNQAGNVVQISGRSANCNGLEAPYEISPLTRWEIGGAGVINVDAAPPPAPVFGLSLPDNVGGTVVFGSVAFPDITNTATVTAGSYTLFYLDELNLLVAFVLSIAAGLADTTITVSPPVTGDIPTSILLDSEIASVTGIDSTGTLLTIVRGIAGSSAATHNIGTSIYTPLQKAVVVPFVKGFFGSPASGDWSYSLSFPNARILAAEMSVTNSQGNSPTSALCYTNVLSGGLRTLSGGQFSFQIAGFISIQTGAAPDIIVDAPKAVRDVYAVVRQAPVGSPITVNLNINGALLCSLTIAAGSTAVGAPIDGTTLPTMRYQDRLSIDVIAVGQTTPGSDLTVVIRV